MAKELIRYLKVFLLKNHKLDCKCLIILYSLIVWTHFEFYASNNVLVFVTESWTVLRVCMVELYVMQDLSKAFKFFSMAAEQGWVDGQLQLGIMYYSTFTASSVVIAVEVAMGLMQINGTEC